MTDEIVVGRWYAYAGDLDSLRGRPIQVLGLEGQAVHGKWANGAEGLLERLDIADQVADAVPGVTEPCLVCGGAEIVTDLTANDRRPGPMRTDSPATKPCPNCRGL
jgi:hypothetical protein